MAAWLESLTALERILFFIAVPATLILLIQTALLLIGLGGDAAGSGTDLDGDGIPDAAEPELDFHGLDLDGDGIPDIPGDFHSNLGDADHGEVPHEGGFFTGLNVFTIRGLVTFATLFGWSGLLFSVLGLHPLPALFFAVQVGIIGMVGVAVLLREALRLQSDGTLDLRNALGRKGSVYLTVPPRRSGTGKVSVTVQEQLREFEAVTDEEAPLMTGEEIQVTGLAGENTLIVSPLDTKEKD